MSPASALPVRTLGPTAPPPAALAVTASRAQAWREAGRQLLARALSEWSFEGMLEPVPLGGDRYRIDLDSGVSYAFEARRGAFGSWQVRPGSITRGAAGLLGDGVEAPVWDALAFLVDAGTTIGTDPATLATYVHEVSATLAADALRLEAGGASAAELRQGGHAELECHMTGHNWLVANKGRLGFSASDSGRYAPEAGARLRPWWIAVHRGLAEFRATPDRSERSLLEHELDEGTIAAFRARHREVGLDPDAYVWVPVHPWQWDHAIQILFAGEVAQRRILALGESPDEYLPQQSIRTLTNVTPAGATTSSSRCASSTPWCGAGYPRTAASARPWSPSGCRACSGVIRCCATTVAWCCSARWRR